MFDAAALATLTAIKDKIALDRDALSAFLKLPPPVPPPVGVGPPLSPIDIAMGCTKTSFFEDWSDPATIDWKSTVAIGAGGFPESSAMFPPGIKWASAFGDYNGITVANSITRIATDPGGRGGNCLSTMNYPSGANRPGDSAHGFAFKGKKSVVHISMACDPSKYILNTKAWPAGWSMSQRQLQIAWEMTSRGRCDRPDGSSPRHMEYDIIEIGYPWPIFGPGNPTSILCALNFWECNKTLTRAYPTCDWNGVVMANPTVTSRPPGFVFPEQNIWSGAYTHPSLNNGQGLIQRFITRPGGLPFHVAECDDTWPAGDPYWDVLDQQMTGDGHYLILGGGIGFPAEFGPIRVTTLPDLVA